MPRRVFLWNGGDPDGVRTLLPLGDALPLLPTPRPLRLSLELGFQWGTQRTDVVAIAGELVTTDWGEDAVTWLHLKAAPVAEYLAGQPLGMRLVLVPVRYVVGIDVGTDVPGGAVRGDGRPRRVPAEPADAAGRAAAGRAGSRAGGTARARIELRRILLAVPARAD